VIRFNLYAKSESEEEHLVDTLFTESYETYKKIENNTNKTVKDGTQFRVEIANN